MAPYSIFLSGALLLFSEKGLKMKKKNQCAADLCMKCLFDGRGQWKIARLVQANSQKKHK